MSGDVIMRSHLLFCSVDGFQRLSSLEYLKYRSIVNGYCKCPICGVQAVEAD